MNSQNLASRINDPIINSLCQTKYITPQVMRQALEGSSLGGHWEGSYSIPYFILINSTLQGVYL